MRSAAPLVAPVAEIGGGIVPHLYGMLYVGEAGERSLNLGAGTADPIVAYVRTAVTVARSARAGVPVDRARWYGGEFLAGSHRHFAKLAGEIADIWPRYLETIDALYHVGDEMIVSAALQRMLARGEPVRGAGDAGLVARWWSRRTVSPIEAWSDVNTRAILHLPSDKDFLAEAAAHPFAANTFLARHRRHATARARVERAIDFADRLRRRPRRHIPRLD